MDNTRINDDKNFSIDNDLKPQVVFRRKRKVASGQREGVLESVEKIKNLDPAEGNKCEIISESSRCEPRMEPSANSLVDEQNFNKNKASERRSNITFFTASRWSSTPRQCKSAVPQEIHDFPPVARRSLSSPRSNIESSESGRSTPTQNKNLSDQFMKAVLPSKYRRKHVSRIERNLKRFEQERLKFEFERRCFEQEKRELARTRYRVPDFGVGDNLLQQQKKIFNKVVTGKQILFEKFLYPQQFSSCYAEQTPKLSLVGSKTNGTDHNSLSSVDYESSTAFSESEIEIFDSSEICSDIQLNAHFEQHPELKLHENITDERTFQKKSFLSRIFGIFPLKKKINETEMYRNEKFKPPLSTNIINLLFRLIFIEWRYEWKHSKEAHRASIKNIRLQRDKCISQIILLAIYCGFGGIFFRFIEGKLETSYKCGLGKVKRDFIDQLWVLSHNLREEDWKSEARNKLRKFEEDLHVAYEDGISSHSGLKSWSFLNSFLYCWTLVTTIGYGHISPTTVVGRAVTIIYAIIGIPMFLILLADFGKLFTRGIKFLWVFVRRMYYTGTFRKIRKNHNVQQMVHGMNIVYEIAMRRPTLANIAMIDPEKNDSISSNAGETPLPQNEQHRSTAETPVSPAPETFSIDDEFNLPITVAIVILLLYIFIGAAIYCMWEEWTYFESIYFVFISMSTIGFGDFVPQHPIFMMCSIAYLIFGLALTSMCINVVQVKLSDSFKQASVKIGATIGFEMSDEEALSTQNQTPIEISSAQGSPKLEKQFSIVSIPKHSTANVNSESPPPIPRRSPVQAERNEKSMKKYKAKNKSNIK